MFHIRWMLFIIGTITIEIDGNEFQSTEPPDDPFSLISARAALCPIIGFHGMFCPGDQNNTIASTSQSRTLSAVLELPTSVGMAIDVSTGDLLLPALQLSAGSQPWTDKESQQTFLVPPEITLTETSSNDGTIHVRLFRTETELVDIWLKNAEAGGWTGGQLAHVQNISDVYKNYFKDNQATAITQELKTMYTVAIKDDDQSLKLNRYAQRAINALTEQYNDELYQNFMDAWGTHITVSTTVGGMTEQQIVFKSCVLSTTEITDGLSQSVFEENLKQELLEKTPCLDKFYYARRRKLLDHRIGGNILLINNTEEWKKTIVYNPALLIVNKYLPWYDFIEDATIKSNLKQAIERRLNATSAIRQAQVRQINQERRDMTFTAKVIVQSSGYTWTTGNDITLRDVNQCITGLTNTELAARCNTGTMMSACPLELTAENGNNLVIGARQVPVCYERNNHTGSFRAVARRQYGERDSNVRTGFTSK